MRDRSLFLPGVATSKSPCKKHDSPLSKLKKWWPLFGIYKKVVTPCHCSMYLTTILSNSITEILLTNRGTVHVSPALGCLYCRVSFHFELLGGQSVNEVFAGVHGVRGKRPLAKSYDPPFSSSKKSWPTPYSTAPPPSCT